MLRADFPRKFAFKPHPPLKYTEIYRIHMILILVELNCYFICEKHGLKVVASLGENKSTGGRWSKFRQLCPVFLTWHLFLG